MPALKLPDYYKTFPPVVSKFYECRLIVVFICYGYALARVKFVSACPQPSLAQLIVIPKRQRISEVISFRGCH